ncbi:MAG: hypothetical protein QNM02_05805 [Acidimicrobiia bacterium]|nr:hypothetical protein [Acidimicrobiia bacterium]
MNAPQNAAYSNLVEAWSRRQDLRTAGTDVPHLGAARIELEDARQEMFRSLRR